MDTCNGGGLTLDLPLQLEEHNANNIIKVLQG
jgi:hypothetical protein